MLDKIIKIWNLKDFRNRLIYVIVLLVIFRILAHIPMPGVNLEELKQFFSRNQIFGLLNLFSGGAMRNFSIAMMGVGPYITSSIIFSLLVHIVPSLEVLSKEGGQGREKINYYTRLATVPLAFMQSYAMIVLLKNQGVLGVVEPISLITMLVSLTAGSILLMWIGELISENGIGNGISLIITLGILAGVPTALQSTLAFFEAGKIFTLVIFAVLALAVTAAIVYINEAERQIPVTYARRVRGMKTVGGINTYLPLKVIMAGVIPIIFALSMMIFPPVIGKFLETAKSVWLVNAGNSIVHIFNNNWFYSSVYFILVVLFTFFYTSIIFQPQQVAENLQKQGGFIPGIRPGRETEGYIDYLVKRIVLVGAVFLGLIAVLPYIVQSVMGIKTLVLGGTGILIVVSVVLETARQIRAQLAMRTYDNY